MAYEKFSPDKSDIQDVAFKYNGNISQIAKHYNVSRETVYQYLNRDPQGKEIIQETRRFNDEMYADLAEYVRYAAMSNYKENPELAVRTANEFIKGKGKARGYFSDQSVQSSYPNFTQIAKHGINPEDLPD